MSRKVLNVLCVGGNESLLLLNMRVAVRKNILVLNQPGITPTGTQ